MINSPHPGTGRPTRFALSAVVAGGLLTGCASDDKSLTYQTDYGNHRPLKVVGYPSAGSLETVQQAVWRLADGDTAGLAALAVDDEQADATARNWVKAFGAAAEEDVTADFYDEGSVRQVVVLYFGKSGQIKEIEARIGEDDSWGLTLAEPDPAEAKAEPSWAPPKPGGSGSRTSGAPSED
ncbi:MULTISPECIES: hypothetical protein [Streptomyces]|uniref:Lipoprotein n=1 Tax=Streptomyces koelreuteriae TaxID=2838015 RepID=A0ABX8FM07_9ACTN|nr:MULTISPECIES: hypothetical protein [Streptomyces]QWB22183.1 hypothetical protein KJK29_06145 [Streptomyces koelreuteriae]UUA05125.1 hypothetical protein NNW98_06180 [Streptomyces koelreuteriae]UUA12750.1 hypothetical protein NNW99_06180 [Streptomyces sp. CRCS-T-1]